MPLLIIFISIVFLVFAGAPASLDGFEKKELKNNKVLIMEKPSTRKVLCTIKYYKNERMINSENKIADQGTNPEICIKRLSNK